MACSTKDNNPIVLYSFTLLDISLWSRLAIMKNKVGNKEPCTHACILILFISFAVLICSSGVNQSKSKLESSPGCHNTHPWTQMTLCDLVWCRFPLLTHRKECQWTYSFTNFKHYKRSLRKVHRISSLFLCLSQHLAYHTQNVSPECHLEKVI